MARLFWIAVGAGAGVWAARKVKDKAYKYTPEGVADNVTGLGEAIKYLADEIRAGMTEREQELYRAIGADVSAAALPPAPARRALPAGRTPDDDDGYPVAAWHDREYDPRGHRGRRGRDTRDEYDPRGPYDAEPRYDRRDGR